MVFCDWAPLCCFALVHWWSRVDGLLGCTSWGKTGRLSGGHVVLAAFLLYSSFTFFFSPFLPHLLSSILPSLN